MKEKHYLVALSAFIPFGPKRIELLTGYFGSAKKVWNSSSKKLLQVGTNEKTVAAFETFRKAFGIESYLKKLEKLKIEFVVRDDKNYPENLKDLDNAPMVLYIRGKLKAEDTNAVAVVGSRKMTSYGREVTEKFSSELANFGITIVSGLARGIDTAAHKGALSVGGRTIAVLGCGLDSVYPPENTQLASEIIEKESAVVSEYPLGHPALPINFASRNRIVSGLSKAVLVVEGAEKSGTLLTASSAADQGRTVFAVPGQITSPLSAAPLFLLKNGAKIATEPSDILEELDIQVKVDREKIEKVMPSTKEETELLEILTNEPLHLDEVARISSLDTPSVSARLTIMELKGLVKNMGGGVYRKI